MNILGISAFYHDSAAALLKNGEIIAAVQEERFSRIKHDNNYPLKSIEFCLKKGNLRYQDIDHIVFYEKPFLKFERLIETYFSMAPKGFSSFKKAIPLWIKDKLFQKNLLINNLNKSHKANDWKEKLLFSEHHMSHAASAFYPSPFSEALILTMDGVGEWATTSVSRGSGNKIEILKEIFFPHSIGLLYSAFTYYLGFKVNSGEYKVMGLAPYGRPIYAELILSKIVDLKEDGSFQINQKYFYYSTGLKMTNRHFHELFNGPPRDQNELLTQRHMDLAASIQDVCEKIILSMTKALYKEYQINQLCLAGGVALNCVANGKILNQNDFKNLWIQPASGDAGGALGAALCGHYQFKNSKRLIKKQDSMKGSLLGPSFDQNEIETKLNQRKARFHILTSEELLEKTAKALVDGKIIGWFQGAMEFGPRALGNRSILADPRPIAMQKKMNLKIKFRESFRPFAPVILRDHLSDWFDMNYDSLYMLLVAKILNSKQTQMTNEEMQLFGIEKLNVSRSEVPTITHVDYTARIQTVDESINPLFYKLIHNFYDKTLCPILINTSFNVRGEPIVCSPEEAFQCFMGSDIDILAIGNAYLIKSEQDPLLKNNYKDSIKKD